MIDKISDILLVAPITFMGLTALSDDIKINFFTLCFIAIFASSYVPSTLFLIPLFMLFSIISTCL